MFAIPAAPTDLAAAPAGATQINLTWQDRSSDETGFRIERSTDGTAWVSIATAPANSTRFTSEYLDGNTLYQYRVRATNASGDSANTAVASARTRLPVGANLPAQHMYAQSMVFADAARTSQLQALDANGGIRWQDRAPTNAAGYPTADFYMAVTGFAAPAGVYTLRATFPQQPSLSLVGVNGSISNVVYSNGNLTADVSVTGQQQGWTSFGITFRNTGGGASRLQLYRPGLSEATGMWNPDWLNWMRAMDPAVMRTMDWNGTNGSAMQSWSERALPSDFGFTSGRTALKTMRRPDGSTETTSHGNHVAWEHIINLSNTLKRDLWINLPYLADSSYVTGLANLIKYGSDANGNVYTSPQANPYHKPLDPNLHVYVEYCNEVWNFMFTQYNWNVGDAKWEVANGDPRRLNYDNVNNEWVWAARRVAHRLTEVSDGFRAVLGDSAMNTRIRPVFAWQLGNTDTDHLRYIERNFGAPSRYFYAVAQAPYWSMGKHKGDYINDRKAAPLVNLSPSDVSMYLDEDMRDQFVNTRLFTNLSQQANYYGLKMLGYEAGPDVFDPMNETGKGTAYMDPGQRETVRDMLSSWFAAGGGVMAWYHYGVNDMYWGVGDTIYNYDAPRQLGIRDIQTLTSPPPVTHVKTAPTEIDARDNPSTGGDHGTTANLGYLSPGASYDYIVQANSAGTYNLALSIAQASPGGLMDVYVNSVKIGAISAPSTANAETFADSAALAIPLKAGINGIRLTVAGTVHRAFSLASLKITQGTPLANTAPFFRSGIEFHQRVNSGATWTQSIKIGDAETPVNDLQVQLTSSNQSLVRNEDLSFTNSNGTLTLRATAQPGVTGKGVITVRLTDDGGLTRSMVVCGIYVMAAPPTNVQVNASSPTAVTVTWTDNASTETSFGVTVRDTASGQEYYATAPANSQSFRMEGLTAGRTYEATVHARPAGAMEDWMVTRVRSGTVTTPALPGGNTAPTVATAATAASQSVNGLSTTLSVLGADNGGESGLTYTWITNGSPGATPTFSVNGTNAAKNTTVTFPQAGSYRLRVQIKDAAGLSITADAPEIRVSESLTSFTLAPQAATVTNGQTTRVTYAGTNQFGQPINYYFGDYTYTLLPGGVGGSIDAFGFYTAPATGTGTATIQATNNGVTNTTTIVVGQPATPAAPTNPSATANSSSQITFTWTDNATDETSYTVQRATDAAFATGLVITSLPAGSTSHVATGLNASTTYYFRVKATKTGAPDSAYASAQATTQGTVQAPAGYTYIVNEGQSYTFTQTVDVAYGANGSYSFLYGVSGTISFNNQTFGDPIPGVAKYGFYRLATTGTDTTDDLAGTMSARGENAAAGETAAKAFDNSTATKWLDFSPTGSWIQYAYAAGKQANITSYSITSANDAPERDPAAWSLKGSNNGGTTWATVDSRTGQSFAGRFLKQTFTVATPGTFKLYRLEITAVQNPSTANSVQLSEIELLGTISDVVLSNRVGSGTASASSNPVAAESAAQAFDSSTSSKWLGNMTASGAWLQYDFGAGNAWAISQYKLTSANDDFGRDPRTWSLLASSDGVNWTTLDSRSAQDFSGRFATNTYSLSNTTAYGYYRLNITANDGSTEGGLGLVQLSELQLLA